MFITSDHTPTYDVRAGVFTGNMVAVPILTHCLVYLIHSMLTLGWLASSSCRMKASFLTPGPQPSAKYIKSLICVSRNGSYLAIITSYIVFFLLTFLVNMFVQTYACRTLQNLLPLGAKSFVLQFVSEMLFFQNNITQL